MATNRAFAYSTVGAITGFTKSGTIVYETSVGSATRELSGSPEGVTYYAGPDEDTYDVVAYAASGIANPGADGSTAQVTFWGSPTGVEADFIKLADYLSGQGIGISGAPFASATEAYNAINDTPNFFVSDTFA